MCQHAGTMHKVTRIHVYASGHEKVSSGNLGSGTLADKTPAHWPRPTENWWSDPQSELLDWQNPETGPKLSADPRSTVFFKSANPLDLSPKSTIRELFKAKSADPRTYSPPSVSVARRNLRGVSNDGEDLSRGQQLQTESTVFQCSFLCGY